MISPLDSFRDGLLAGHVALVTGGGTGICRGIAHAYARLGADVAIVSRKADVLEQTAAELREATGRTILPLAADVRDPEAVGRVVATTVEKLGKLTTLVNGAAGNFLAPAAGLSPNGFKTVVEIDLVGTFVASRAAFPGPIGDTEGMRRLAPGDAAARAKAGIPAGRFGTIEEIAAAAVFLRSPAAAYVTGHVMVVDGGHCGATPSLMGA